MDNKTTLITVSTGDLVSIPDVASEFNVHFTTVYRWIRAGIVRPFYIGKTMYLTKQEVDELKKKREESK